ncbi:hypothetical protein [Caballeronia glathei]|uniref:hypothetical protein n=1 Tax=Caballeronia glathei TaxID=60547 RepID=UPI00157A91DD|nr:hypothetical protein [Caballeronia glathei]
MLTAGLFCIIFGTSDVATKGRIMRWVVFLLFVGCAAHTHWRGKVRPGFFRQLSDHSTLMSPLNVFVLSVFARALHALSSAIVFSELAPIKEQWEIIRREAVALHEASKIPLCCQVSRGSTCAPREFGVQLWLSRRAELPPVAPSITRPSSASVCGCWVLQDEWNSPTGVVPL